MFAEKLTQAPEDGNEATYLKIILDSLVQEGSMLKKGDVDLSSQFLQELKDSVEATLRVDSQIKEEVRTKVINAFDVLIENYAKHAGVLP